MTEDHSGDSPDISLELRSRGPTEDGAAAPAPTRDDAGLLAQSTPTLGKAFVEGWCHADVYVALLVFVAAWALPVATMAQHANAPDVQTLTKMDGEKFHIKAGFLDFPYVAAGDRICPDSLLLVICFSLPLVVAVALAARMARPSPLRVRSYFLAWFYSMALTWVVTNFLKRYVGYPRPYFYGECEFDHVEASCTGHGASGHANVTADADGRMWRSFPSGHASFAASALCVATLMLLGHARIAQGKSTAASPPSPPPRVAVPPRPAHHPPLPEDRRGKVDIVPFKIIASLAPLWVALWVSASRVREGDHHPADIVAGMALGGFFAGLFYHVYFPTAFADRPEVSRAEARLEARPDAQEAAGIA